MAVFQVCYRASNGRERYAFVEVKWVKVKSLLTGAQLGNFEGGRRYICNRKDEIIHILSRSVKCVAPLLRDMSLANFF